MSETYIFANSFAALPEEQRHRLRTFLDTADSASPLQDPLFFGERRPNEIHLLVERKARPVFFALAFENAALSRFLPRLKACVVEGGPVADDVDALMSGLGALKDLAKKRSLCEVHINPLINQDSARDVERTCATLGFQALASEPPAVTVRLDVSRDFDEILARFRKETRYEVTRGPRFGITVRRAETETDFSRFYEIYQRRASQKGFSARSIDEFRALSDRIRTAPERSALFLSEHRGDIFGGAVMLRAGPRVHYLYSATSDRAGTLPGIYPIIGHAIKWAKEIGCTELDFGGYGRDPLVSRFKKGFSGEIRTFVPAYGLTLRPIVSNLRRMARLFR